MINLRDLPSGSPKYEAVQKLISIFKIDMDEIIGSKELTYQNIFSIDDGDKKVIDKTLASSYGMRNIQPITLALSGILEELFDSKTVTIGIPVIYETDKTEIIKSDEILKRFIGPIAKGGLIEDKYYVVISAFIKAIPIGVTSEGRAGFLLNRNSIKYGKGYSFKEKRNVGELSTTSYSFEDILAKEISLGYINQSIGDESRNYGYTHTLRAMAHYYALPWARRVTMSWRRINVVAASKGSGKTYYAAEIASKEMFRDKKGFGGRKIRKIKYFVPDKANIGSEVMDYMKNFLLDFTRKKTDDGRPVIEISESRGEIRCNLTNTVFNLVSLRNFGEGGGVTGEGLACDVAIIDECNFIPNKFWEMFQQRALMETESIFCITTINEKTEKDHWFYDLLVDGEMGNDMISSHRVDIFERKYLMELAYKEMTPVNTEQDAIKMQEYIDQQMDFILKNLRKGGLREYYARAFCIILDQKKVFDVVTSICEKTTIEFGTPEAYNNDYYIGALDFGGNADPYGISIANITKGKMVYEENGKGIQYLDQLRIAKELKAKFKNIIFVGDATTIGKVMMQEDQKTMEPVIDYWIQFTGTGEYSYSEKGFWVVSKDYMVKISNLCLDKGMMKLSNHLETTIYQMQNFVKLTGSNSKVAKYQGKSGVHDEMVDTFMMICFTLYIILGLSTIEQWKDYGVEFDSDGPERYNPDNYESSFQTSYSLSGNIW